MKNSILIEVTPKCDIRLCILFESLLYFIDEERLIR